MCQTALRKWGLAALVAAGCWVAGAAAADEPIDGEEGTTVEDGADAVDEAPPGVVPPPHDLPSEGLSDQDLPSGELSDRDLSDQDLPSGELPDQDLSDQDLPSGELSDRALPDQDLPSGDLQGGSDL